MTPLGRISPATLALVVLAACAQGAIAAPPVRLAEDSVEFAAQSAPRSDPVVFDNGKIYTVYTQPTAAPIVRLQRRTRITAITTYHWNDGQGAEPGYIGLVDADGRTVQ